MLAFHPVPSRSIAVLLILAASCGARLVLRPLELDLTGLSGQAQSLEVKLAEPRAAPPCDQLDPAGAASIEAEQSAVWQRGTDPGRTLIIDAFEGERVLVIAIARDRSGMPIQLGCKVFEYAELERPEQVIELTMQPP